MTKDIRHSNVEIRWGTAPSYTTISRTVLGITATRRDQSITVDPFSEDRFNVAIGAERILTGEKTRDGYKDRWLADDACPRADAILAGFALLGPAVENYHTAHVNPPGEKEDDGKRHDNVKNAWRLLDEYHRLGWLGGGALCVLFSLNQFQTLQGVSERSPLHGDFLRCVPARRQPFVRHDASPEKDDAPSQPSAIVLLPSLDEVVAAEQARVFANLAHSLGEVW